MEKRSTWTLAKYLFIPVNQIQSNGGGEECYYLLAYRNKFLRKLISFFPNTSACYRCGLFGCINI